MNKSACLKSAAAMSLALTVLTWEGFAFAASKAAVNNEIVAVPVLAPGAETQTVDLVKLATTLADDQPIGLITYNLCIDRSWQTWDAANASIFKRRITATFADEVRAAGFKTGSTPTNLFQQEPSSGDLLIAAALTELEINACDTGKTRRKGSVSVSLEWQIYSNTQKRTVATILTSGTYRQDPAIEDGAEKIARGAIAINVRKLLASSEFRTLYLTKPPATAPTATGGKLSTLSYSNKNNGPSAIPDGVGAVVAIFTSDGFGSGFMIGSEGLLLTNEHVVGKDKFVKVRWADGFETVGEVLRSDAKRDVALVKTDSRGRAPLKLATAAPQPGEDVYAIGMPQDTKLQSTVTKGVVSANRVMDGFSFIQSDVSVTNGNSGGPLLEMNDIFVGFSYLGYQPTGEQINVNLFIPIRDALDFLALKPAG